MDSFKDIIYKNASAVSLIDDIGKAILKRKPSPQMIKGLQTGAKIKKAKPVVHTMKNHGEIEQYLSKYLGPDKAKQVLNDRLVEGGTGSLFLDGAFGLGKMVKPLKPKINNTVLNLRKNMDHFDMRAGNVLGKNNKIFNQTMDFNLGRAQDGMSDNIKRVTVKRLSAPYSKVKDAVLPMAGAMTLSSQLYKNKEEEDMQYGQ